MKIKYTLFILFTFFSVIVYGADIDEIKSLSNSIKSEEKELTKLSKEGKSVVASIAIITSKVENYNKLILAIDRESANNIRRVETIRGNIISISNDIKKIKKNIARSNIFVINNLGYSYIKVIATAKNPESTIKTLEILEIANANLFKQIGKLNEKSKALAILIDEERVKLKEIEALKAERVKALSELESEKANQKSHLTMIKHDEAGRKEYLEFLKFQRKSLEDELKRKVEEGKRKKIVASAFSKLKGNIAYPITNGTIIDQFGSKFVSDAGVYIFNHGIKISARFPSDVFSCAGGEVVFAEYMKGFDNLVIISHGSSYYTVYGNMTALNVSVGGEVLEGSIIGKIAGGDYLYFEIRINDEALNPNDWFAYNKRR